jgi:hypothetical protein
MLAGVSAASFRNLKLNAGVLIEDLVFTGEETLSAILAIIETAIKSPKCLGATRGGSTFVSEAETRQIEFDGQRLRFKGDMVKDSVTARLETNLLEFTADNIRRIMPTADIEVDDVSGSVSYRERTRINIDTDYMKKLSLVADRSDGGVIIFTLYNPMNTSGMNLSGEDKNEGEIPVVFEAFNASYDDRDFAPYQVNMWIVPKAAAPESQSFKI